jgi:hypothetical protein
MPTILLNMKTSKCRSDYLLNFIEATIKYLESFLLSESETRQAAYKSQLCNALTTALDNDRVITYLLEGPYNDSVKIRDDMGRADTAGMLAAAAAVGNKPALMYLAGKVYNISSSSKLYGVPLVAAAVNGQMWAASFIFERIKLNVKATQQLWYAIVICMKRRPWLHDAMLPTLLAWFFSLNPSATDYQKIRGQCASWAIKTGNVDVLQICHTPDVRPSRGLHCEDCSREYCEFQKACRYGHASVIRFFLNQDTAQVRHRRITQISLTLGLGIAAAHGWLVAAKLLLDNGAQINESVGLPGGTKITAIANAVKGKHLDMVVLLLAYGAQVLLDDGSKQSGEWHNLSMIHLACEQGGSMRRVVLQAAKEQSKST